MESIYHEKQVGQLCGKHCLNNLLQGIYFTEIDLATIAKNIDEQERSRMAEGGVNSDEYRQFISAPSTNMDDSGFFSVQVITSALSVWNLEAIPFASRNQVAQDAQRDPTSQKAYICNYQEHWFTIRKIGRQWFNLNSMLSGPELISSTYLSLYLNQLQQEGYSIFVIHGKMPYCQSDEVLMNTLISQPTRPRLMGQQAVGNSSKETSSQFQDNNDDLQKALRLSLQDNNDTGSDLALAMALSMSSESQNVSNALPKQVQPVSEEEDGDELERAIRLSLEQFNK